MRPVYLLVVVTLPIVCGDVAAATDTAPAEKGQPAHTDRYGDPLPDGAIARLGTLRFRHDSWILSLTFSPDGKSLLMTDDHAQRVHVWDVSSGKPVPVPPGAIEALAVRAGGFVPAAKDLHVRCAVPTARGVLQFQGWDHACFSPDGRLLVTRSSAIYPDRDNPVFLWDVASRRRLAQCGGQIFSALISPDGKSLAAGNLDGTLRLFDLPALKERPSFRAGQQHTDCWPRAFSPDSGVLVFGRKGLRRWDLAAGKELLPPKESPPVVHCAAYSPDGKVLAAAEDGADGSCRIWLWEAKTDRLLRRLDVGFDALHALAFSPDGKLLASGGYGQTVRLWVVATGAEIRPVDGHAGPVHVAVSPDGKVIATAGGQGYHLSSGRQGDYLYLGDRVVRLWDRATGRELRRISSPEGHVFALAFSPDGKTLALGGSGKSVYLLDAATGKPRGRLGGYQKEITALTFSADGKILAAVEGEGRLFTWDVRSREPRPVLEGLPDQRGAAVFAPDGKWGASVVQDGYLRVWDLATGKCALRLPWIKSVIGRPPGSYGIHFLDGVGIAFTPNGRLLVAPSGGALAVWEVASGKKVRAVRLEESISFGRSVLSPDGRILAVVDPQGSPVRLVEVVSGKVIGDLQGHRTRVRSLAFTPDGRALVTGSSDTTAMLWDLTGWGREGPGPQAVLKQQELEKCWEDLAGPNAAAAFRAVWRLVAGGKASGTFLGERLPPESPLGAALRDRLLKELGSDRFVEREAAGREWERRGEEALPVLRKALAGPLSLEARRRAERIVEKLAAGTVAPSPEELRRFRAVQALEYLGTPEARRALGRLAGGAPEARLTQEAQGSLQRLAKRVATP